jgi:Ni/Fe-hydrogenase subunit HybB-like protein
MNLLAPLSRIVPILLGAYMAAKLVDMNIRETWRYLTPANWTMESTMFVVEMVFGIIVPFFMMLSGRIRRSPGGLVIAALLVVLGVALNRVNVFLVAFTPIYPKTSYFPAIGEIAVTAGLIAALIFLYRLTVTYFPVISVPSKVETA